MANWYRCPRCNKWGFPSILAVENNVCTDCSNHFRHGHPDPKESTRLPLGDELDILRVKEIAELTNKLNEATKTINQQIETIKHIKIAYRAIGKAYDRVFEENEKRKGN